MFGYVTKNGTRSGVERMLELPAQDDADWALGEDVATRKTLE